MRIIMLLAVLAAEMSLPLSAAGFEPPAQKERSVVRPVMWWPDLKMVNDNKVLPSTTTCFNEAKQFNEEWSRVVFTSRPPFVNFKEYFVVVTFRELGLDYGTSGGLEVDAKGNAKVLGEPIYPHTDSDRRTYSTTIGVFPRRGITTIHGQKLAEKRLTSEAEAVSRFREIRASIGLNPVPDERVTVRREKARDCLARVKDTLKPAQIKTNIRGGDLSALDTNESCWSVHVDHGIEGGQAAYFDDKGHLLFAWYVPEG